MRRRVLFVAATAALLFVALTALVAVRAGPLMRADAAISAAARRAAIGHPAWRTFVAAVTTTGGPTPVTVATVTAVVFLFGIRHRREAVFVAATMLSASALRLIVLNAVARPRPADRLAAASGFSFPSGHTTESATAALVALGVLWPYLRGVWRRIVPAVAVLWAAAVGISRVALVVHWPSDVLGGWLLATGVVAASLLLLGRRPSPGALPGRSVSPGALPGRSVSPGARPSRLTEPASEPGVGQLDELGGGGHPGRGEREDQGDGPDGAPMSRPGSGVAERLDPADGDAAVDS